MFDIECRVLVTGGRNYNDRNAVFAALDKIADTEVRALGKRLLVIHGACCRYGKPTELRGADRWSQEWAQEREFPYIGVPAAWRRFDKMAGPERNQRMLDDFRPTNVVAFPGGPGTANMVELAHTARLQVWEPVNAREVTRRTLGRTTHAQSSNQGR